MYIKFNLQMLHGQQKCHHIVYINMDVPDHLISIIDMMIIRSKEIKWSRSRPTQKSILEIFLSIHILDQYDYYNHHGEQMIRPHSARDDNRDFLMRYLLSMFGPNCIIHTYIRCSIYLCMYNTYTKKVEASRK